MSFKNDFSEILTAPKMSSRAAILVVALVAGFAPVAMGDTVNFRCASTQASVSERQDPALLQIQGGDLISNPRVMFGQPSFQPILNAAPEAFSAPVPTSELSSSPVASKLNQFAVATASSGNIWSSRHSDIYVDKKLLSLEEAQGNVVVVSRQNSLVRSGGPATVVVYSCEHL